MSTPVDIREGGRGSALKLVLFLFKDSSVYEYTNNIFLTFNDVDYIKIIHIHVVLLNLKTNDSVSTDLPYLIDL